MNNSYQTVLQILKAFLYNQETRLNNDTDWEKVVNLLEINSISGIAGYVIDQLTDITLPNTIKTKCENVFFGTISATVMRDEGMEYLIEQLNRNSIDHLIFKGWVIKSLYTIPELRTSGDVDFAIHPKDRNKCHTLMLKLGYQVHDDWEPVYSYYNDMECYEIHTQLLDFDPTGKHEYQKYFSDYWNHTSKKENHTFVLDIEYHLMYLITHIYKHLYGSGAGIRMYLDIAFYVQKYREEINWGEFLAETKKLGFDRFVNTIFFALERWFGIESPIELYEMEPEIIDQFTEFTINGGVFGYADKKAGKIELRKSSKGTRINRVGAFFDQALPSAKTLEPRYTYLQNKPWLLPVAWVHRLFKKKKTTAYYIDNVKGILSVDAEEIREMQNFYKKIGV